MDAFHNLLTFTPDKRTLSNNVIILSVDKIATKTYVLCALTHL